METGAPKKMGRIRASYLLAAESFEYVRKDPEMLWYPVLASIAHLIFFAVMMALMFVFMPADFEQETFGPAGYAVLFGWYLVTVAIFSYFQGAIATVVDMRIRGIDPSFGDGIRNVNKHFLKIIAWSAFSATVGVLLQFLSDRFGWVGKIFGFAGSIAWAVFTFFMIPVLVLEDKTLRGSLSRSGSIFKQTWGETLVMNVSLGLFFGMLYILLIIGYVLLLVAGFTNLTGDLGAWVFGGVSALFVLILLAIAVLHSALSAVFKVVLYEYAANGTIADSFTPELIIGAMKKKDA